jgi:DNA-binding NarL/FixJ family response regulator
MRGWFVRAERLLSGVPRCAESGWLRLLRASMLSNSAELEQAAAETVGLAQEFLDHDLEALAIAFCGLAQVNLGRVGEGMANLDEAMASAYSGELDYMTISEIFCVMLSACELAGDLDRTEEWCRTAAEYAQEHHCPFLSAYCRTTYGALLTLTGKWQQADQALIEAIRIFDAGHRGLRVHAVIRLADLRVYQGKLEEAEALLAGYEDQEDAALPLARLYLARGETGLARAVLEHALPPGQAPGLQHAALLRLLVDVLLAAGALDEAASVAARLSELAEQTQSDLLIAQAALAQGGVKQRRGDAGALEQFETALQRLRAHEQSILASRARLEMARIVQKEDPAAAITWAKAAMASFQRVGAAHDAEEADQLLRQLGARQNPGPRTDHPLSKREEEVYALLSKGLTNREIAGRLVLSEKTVEHHVTSILTKLNARSRAEAIALAIKDSAERKKPQ